MYNIRRTYLSIYVNMRPLVIRIKYTELILLSNLIACTVYIVHCTTNNVYNVYLIRASIK